MRKPITTLTEALDHVRAGGQPLLVNNLSAHDMGVVQDALRDHAETSQVLAAALETAVNERDAAHVRKVQAERRATELEQRLEDMAPPTDLPRTITLTYTPHAPDRPDCIHPDEFYDRGGYWCVIEGAGMQEQLEAQEAMVLVSAMLLGAKHPPLKSMAWAHAQMRRAKLAHNNLVDRLPIIHEPVDLDRKPPHMYSPDELIEIVPTGFGYAAVAYPWEHWEKKGYPAKEIATLVRRGGMKAAAYNQSAGQLSDTEVVDAEFKPLVRPHEIDADELVQAIHVPNTFKPVWVPRAWAIWTQTGYDNEQVKEIMARAEREAARRNGAGSA